MPSALPSVMLRKKEALAKQHEENKVVVLPNLENSQQRKEPDNVVEELTAAEIAEMSTGETKPVTEQVVEAPPVKVETTTQLASDEDKDLNWKYKALQGSHEVAVRENKEMRNKYAELEARIEELTAQLAKPKEKVETVDDSDIKLTPEEEETYASSLPVLNKLLAANQRQIERSVINPLKEEIEHLKKNNKDVVTKIAAVDEGSFLQQVKSRVTDFDAKVATSDWKEFLSKPVDPYTQTTIGEALWRNGHQKRNLDLVLQIFNDFDKSRKNNVAAAYAAPSMSAASGSLANGVTEHKPMLKMSARRHLHEEFKKGRITLKKYQATKDLFDQAEKEGRIDYDK